MDGAATRVAGGTPQAWVGAARDRGAARAARADVRSTSRAAPPRQVWKDGSKVEEFCGANEAKLRALIEKYSK